MKPARIVVHEIGINRLRHQQHPANPSPPRAMASPRGGCCRRHHHPEAIPTSRTAGSSRISGRANSGDATNTSAAAVAPASTG